MGWVIVFLVVSALLQQKIPVVEGARIKIHLSEESAIEPRARSLRICQPLQSACSDKVELNNALNSGLPSTIQSMLNDRVRFFISNAATQNVEACVLSRVVSGLGEQRVRDVFTALEQKGCYPFFYGGVVRDLLLGKAPADVDLEADCETEQVYNICNETWGAENCRIGSKAHIGVEVCSPDDLIDAASTNSTFFANLSALEYTVNALAYDSNGINNVIVDLTGKGVNDVCSKTIRIPSNNNSRESWNEWSDTSKLYRFWKLRVKGFMPSDDQTLDYIVERTKDAIESDLKSFKKFYCKTAYEGAGYDDTRNACNTTEQTCMDRAYTARNYMLSYSADFADYYCSMLKTNIPRCGKYMAHAAQYMGDSF